MPDLATKGSAEEQSRTVDTRIFSPLLYHLSYLGAGKNLPYVASHVNGTNCLIIIVTEGGSIASEKMLLKGA